MKKQNQNYLKQKVTYIFQTTTYIPFEKKRTRVGHICTLFIKAAKGFNLIDVARLHDS